jgi:hypothetical protein
MSGVLMYYTDKNKKGIQSYIADPCTFNPIALKIKSDRILHLSYQRLTIESSIFSTHFSNSVCRKLLQ